MSQLPTLIEAMVTLDNCCDELMKRNSVFESLNINLCETKQALTSATKGSNDFYLSNLFPCFVNKLEEVFRNLS